MSTSNTLDIPEKTTSHSRYDTYKDSGVEWFGEIPEHWGIYRLKRTVTGCKNGYWGDTPEGDESDLPVVRVADFDRFGLRIPEQDFTVRSVPEDKRGGRLLKDGDLLLEKSGGGEKQPVGAVVLYDLDKEAVSSNFIGRMRVKDGYNPSFLRYVHAALYDLGVNERAIKQSIGIQNLDADYYLRTRVPTPPLPEQRVIAAYLDRETERIDALVAKKERLIELLEEKRTALISHAVTKGLDAAAEMKDSGVEWIGCIPKEWETAKLKFAARLESGHTPSRSNPEYWSNCTIPWVTLADVGKLRTGKVNYIQETEEMISETGLKNSAARLLPKGTVILSRTASVGFSAILEKPMATTQDFANWVCGPYLFPEYLLQCLRGMSHEFERLIEGSTHKTIYMPDIRRFEVPIPPMERQKRIAQHIDSEVYRIDLLTDKVQKGVDYLKEYRTALISAAVTGQINVRESV